MASRARPTADAVLAYVALRHRRAGVASVEHGGPSANAFEEGAEKRLDGRADSGGPRGVSPPLLLPLEDGNTAPTKIYQAAGWRANYCRKKRRVQPAAIKRLGVLSATAESEPVLMNRYKLPDKGYRAGLDGRSHPSHRVSIERSRFRGG